jgi:hypothetical protein
MLGPIGPLASNFLRSRGFVITRPSDIERAFTRSFWEQWFSKDPILFGSVYGQNRETLASIPTWIHEKTLAASFWRYGVPVEWSEANLSIDKTGLMDIEGEITVADLISFIARQLREGVSYLEIGVSVGKNILQIERQITSARLVGLDIEEINPILEDQFSDCIRVNELSAHYPVATLSNRTAQKQSSMKRLTSRERGNVFEYLSADQFRDDTWSRLRGKKFNLIFSDGVHTPSALKSELQFLIKYDLVDPSRCVMLWDDLYDFDMQVAFLDNARTLCKMFNHGDEAISLYQLHGSYGPKRLMGMFSSIK